MTEELRLAGRRDLDWTLLAPLLAHVTVTHVAVLVVRVTVSYRSIELGLPALWLGIIAASLRYRIDNSYLVEVPYYRAGTKVPDGLINISLGFLTWLRLVFGLRSSRAALTRRLHERKILAGTASPIPSALKTPGIAAPVPATARVPANLDR